MKQSHTLYSARSLAHREQRNQRALQSQGVEELLNPEGPKSFAIKRNRSTSQRRRRAPLIQRCQRALQSGEIAPHPRRQEFYNPESNDLKIAQRQRAPVNAFVLPKLDPSEEPKGEQASQVIGYPGTTLWSESTRHCYL